MNAKKPLAYQIGSSEVLYYPDYAITLRNFNKVCVCPNCFGTIHFGRNSDKHQWARSYRDYIYPDKFRLNCRNEDAFYEHMIRCVPILENGVNRIDFTSHERACSMVDFFSHRSKWGDDGYFTHDHRRVCKGDLNSGESVSYMYIDDNGPASCAMFRFTKYDGVVVPYLVDVYTFPPFRHKGYATEMIEYAIKDMEIDKSSFLYLYPTNDKLDGIFNSLQLTTIPISNY